MLGRNEVVWLALRSVGVHPGGETRWEVVECYDCCRQVCESYDYSQHYYSGKFMLLCWSWLHGWNVVGCHGMGSEAEGRQTNAIHDGEDNHLIDLLWSELTAFQHCDEIVNVSGKYPSSLDMSILERLR